MVAPVSEIVIACDIGATVVAVDAGLDDVACEHFAKTVSPYPSSCCSLHYPNCANGSGVVAVAGVVVKVAAVVAVPLDADGPDVVGGDGAAIAFAYPCWPAEHPSCFAY